MQDQTKNSLKKSALAFVLLMGIVSMFSDLTHEGAKSLYGAFLTELTASPATIGLVAGLGVLLGNALRLLTGIWADKHLKYWTMTLIGYAINLLAIPALALAGPDGWLYAATLIVAERFGKAIRQPAKNTLVSFATEQLGAGKSFAIQEALDQLGAFLGPSLLALVLFLQPESGNPNYRICFALLGIPAILTLGILLLSKHYFPTPEKFETKAPAADSGQLQRLFWGYVAALTLLALGFADFPLITLHAVKQQLCAPEVLPLLYALAMLTDAVAALFFGWQFDRFGLKVLIPATLLSVPFAYFAFGVNQLWGLWLGAGLWGIGMGAQESVLKSAVAVLLPKNQRGKGFGIFGAVFGFGGFLASYFAGVLYEVNLPLLIGASMASQLAATIGFGVLSSRALPKALGK